MTKKYPADGTYVMVASETVDPFTLVNFSDNTTGLTDSKILNTVRYVSPDSPEIPKHMKFIKGEDIARMSRGMQWRVALWPGEVCAVLHFPAGQMEPRKLQLIRAYRKARHAKRAVEFHDLENNGQEGSQC